MRAGRSSLPLFTPSSWSGPNKPRTRTLNSLGSLCTARCSFAASAPSEVTSSSPPSTPGMGLTAMKRRPAVLGSRSISAARSAVDSRSGSPGDRLKMNTCAAAAARVLMGRPSSRMSSAAVTFWPSSAMRPLTVSRCARIHSSTPRREARPRCARYFCNRSATSAGAGRGVAWMATGSALVGRRRRHQAGGGISRRGQFLVVAVVIGGGIELVGAVLDRRAPAPPRRRRRCLRPRTHCRRRRTAVPAAAIAGSDR